MSKSYPKEEEEEDDDGGFFEEDKGDKSPWKLSSSLLSSEAIVVWRVFLNAVTVAIVPRALMSTRTFHALETSSTPKSLIPDLVRHLESSGHNNDTIAKTGHNMLWHVLFILFYLSSWKKVSKYIPRTYIFIFSSIYMQNHAWIYIEIGKAD